MKLKTEMKNDRVTALYIRVSTDAQAEEGYSIEAQQEMLEGYCRSKRIENYKFYIDGGFSGSNIERPKMRQLIEDIKKGKIAAVIVYKLDRLSRSQKDTLFLIEDVLNPNNTEFVSLNENLDTSTSIGRAMLGIMSAFAQLERETIKERTRMGMKKRVESGLWMGGGKIPYGFDYDKNLGKLKPNSDAETVKKIYSMYISGYSAGSIALATGIKYDQSVLQILKRKSNYGAIEYKGTVYENCHKPIIDRKTYDAAQAEMKRRQKQRAPKSGYLLSGLLVCGNCGAKMRYQKWGKYSTKIVCYSTQRTKPYLVKDPFCDIPRFEADDIENAVLNEIFEIKTGDLSENSSNFGGIITELRARYKETYTALGRLYDLYAKDGDRLLLSKIGEMKKELKELGERIDKETELGAATESRLKTAGEITKVKDLWQFMTIQKKQGFIRSIVSHITLFPEKIEITFRI